MTVLNTGKISFLHHDNSVMGRIDYSTSDGDPRVTFYMDYGAKRAELFLSSTQNSGASAGIIANHSTNYTGFILNTGNSHARLFGLGLVLENYGITIGGLAIAAPAPAGVLRMKERTSAVGTPPAGTADLYILKRNNKQELYIKFADGSGFTLATSTA